MGRVRLRYELAARWLREELASGRRAQKLSQDQAAERLGIVKKTVFRYESGHSLPTFDVLTEMCKLYEIDPDGLVPLLTMAKQAGWWSEYAHILNATYAEHCELEQIATGIDACAQGFVPGFLQTREYATFIETQSDRRPGDLSGQYVELRLARQARLLGKPDVQIRVVIDEAIIHKNSGGASTSLAQRFLLQSANDQTNTHIRVMEFKTARILPGTFQLFWTPWRSVQCSESFVQETHHETAQQVERFSRYFDVAWQASTPLEEITG